MSKHTKMRHNGAAAAAAPAKVVSAAPVVQEAAKGLTTPVVQEQIKAVSTAPAVPEPAKPASAGTAAEEPVTPANLQTAYSGEMNAHTRYLEFAKEADEEGYAPVASLFRAAARSEQIHANNHAEAIRGLGEEPKPQLETPVVKSARANLEAAIQGEVYERDEMYPTFVHQARVEGNRAAARTFHLAQKAETEHAALFTEALEQLERLRGEAVVYYVCPVCGFTTAQANGLRCPVCSTAAEQFERVS